MRWTIAALPWLTGCFGIYGGGGQSGAEVTSSQCETTDTVPWDDAFEIEPADALWSGHWSGDLDGEDWSFELVIDPVQSRLIRPDCDDVAEFPAQLVVNDGPHAGTWPAAVWVGPLHSSLYVEFGDAVFDAVFGPQSLDGQVEQSDEVVDASLSISNN